MAATLKPEARDMSAHVPVVDSSEDPALAAAAPLDRSNILIVDDRLDKRVAVSYTHLTLPTKRIV